MCSLPPPRGDRIWDSFADTRLFKRKVSLVAFIALSTVESISGCHACQGKFQRKMLKAAYQILFVPSSVRGVNDYGMGQANAEDVGKSGEEFWGCVGEGVAVQRADCDSRDIVGATPDGGEAKQQDVSARDEDGIVWGLS